jgi:hypothetical protein
MKFNDGGSLLYTGYKESPFRPSVSLAVSPKGLSYNFKDDRNSGL